jgi:hypothetical protein
MGENVLTALTNMSCSEIDPDMTCSRASCTTQTAATQHCEGAEQAGTFRCLQPGFFPDPADCKVFHVCGSDLSHFSGKQNVCCDVILTYSLSLIYLFFLKKSKINNVIVSPLFFNFALEYAVRKVHSNHVGLKLNGTHHIGWKHAY